MKTIFWNVDTQYDFMSHDGKLSVPGAEAIEGNLGALTKYARVNDYQIVNTADWHNKDSKEFSSNPDYVNTFPEHCVIGTKGAEFIEATQPINPYVIDWRDQAFDSYKLNNAKEVVLYKDAFSIFEGNKFANEVVQALNPDNVIVYGVATNVCVDQAVQGLLSRGKNVYVVQDAVKELPESDLEKIFSSWKGVNITSTKKVLEDRLK